MKETLYLECYSGISGDMTVAALLDLGADQQVLNQALASLPVQGFVTQISRVMKSGIDACDFDVALDSEHENYDHDMEYLHGPEEIHGHEPVHVHHHEHRGLEEICRLIEETEMTDSARALAEKIFTILAEAESKAHRVPIDKVHFHEVGAVDSIVDIISVAVCLDNLKIKEVIVPWLSEGRGMVRCQHGILPVPVPAVSNILQSFGLPVEITRVEGELITPTGAAIVAAVKTADELPSHFTVKKIGIGAGKRQYECPGVLRAMLIETDVKKQDIVCKLETNIDDCTGENLGYVMDRLFEAGARDVHYMPVFMKKNRPAWQLNVICREEDISKLEQIIFHETTTIGIRRTVWNRTVLEREQNTVRTPYGEALVKVCDINGKKRYYPEYESIVKLCGESGWSYMEMYQEVVRLSSK